MRSVFIKYIYFITVLLCVAQIKGVAQEVGTRPYKGKVTGPDNKPLVHVEVTVQERNRMALTAKDGSFLIKAEPGEVLFFSAKDFVTVERKAGDASGLNIVLQPSVVAAGEEDDVIIPFGVRKQRELTYSISTLKGDKLPQIPIGSLTPLLGGRLAGLYMQQTNNGPGNDNASLQVRGRSTYNTGNSARVLVDGVFRDYADMDVNEIESITVLKDAAALTWYGLNAANGVVMITTKKGSKRKTAINFDSQVGFQQRVNNINPLSSKQYATVYNEALANAGRPPVYNPAALDAYQNHTDPYKFPDNNYIDQFMGQTAPVQRYVLSATGGSNSFRYFTMLSYFNQQGFFKPTETEDFNSQLKFQRVNFRVNLDYDVNANLSISLNAGGRTGSLREPQDGAAGLLTDLYNLPPNAFPVLNTDGTYGGTSVYQNNPLGRLQDRGFVRNLSRALLVTGNAKYKMNFITEGLSANLLISYDAQGNYQSGLTKNYEVFDTSAVPVRYRTAAPLNYLSSSFSGNNRRNEIWAGFDYDRQFRGEHKINASVRFMRSVNNAVERLDYRGQQVSARVDYGFKGRYILGLVASYAGSENFAPDRRYGFFPAISAGWLLSEEGFLKNATALNYLKVRSSYGVMGNGDIGGTRLPFRTLYRAPAGFGYAFGTGFAATVSSDETSPAGNPLISWEKLNKFNAGADAQLFNRSLSISVDYFDDKRTDILTTPRVPGILGIALIGVNQGAVTSKGFEGSVNFEKEMGDITLSISGNYTYAKNKRVAINEEPGIPAYQSVIGTPTGGVSGVNRFYVSQGLFQTQAEIDASPTQGPAGVIKPGDIKYKDINGDGVINGFDAVNTNYTEIPSSFYGFGLGLKYKIFQLSTQFQGVTGRTIQIKSLVNAGPSGFNQLSLDRWTPTTAATATFPRLAISDRANNNLDSDFWLRSGDFLKLRTVEFSVSIPEAITNRMKIQKARLFVAGYNLWNAKKLDIGVDPEMPGAGYGSAYPNLKTYTFGINLQF
jgi:TonB-linked SusC/RagA family outer membrane protein